MEDYQKTRQKKPHYTEKNGKIYHLSVELHENEARAVLERNKVRRAENEAQVKAASDPMQRTMMKTFADMAARDFDDDERELGEILAKRAAVTAPKK